MYQYPSAYYFLFDASSYVSEKEADVARAALMYALRWSGCVDVSNVEFWCEEDIENMPFFFLKYNSEVEILPAKAKWAWTYEIPKFTCGGASKLGAALMHVSEHISRNRYSLCMGHFKRPSVYVFTSGKPTDDVYDGYMALKK